ncbi:MAG: cytochrome c oxidase assembly protein [Acidimicrobiales bacterium]
MPGISGVGRIAVSVHGALTQWQIAPFPLAVVVVLVLLAVWYLRAERRLAARGRRWSGWRIASFFVGLASIDVALQSPLVAYTGEYFEAHVMQHLLLMVVAPPLLALGAPSTLLLQTSSRAFKTRWLKLLRSRPFAVISHPVVVWIFYYGVMFGFFLTPLLNFAVLHIWLLDCINLGFLSGAALFWWPMVGVDPVIHWNLSYPARMGNILLGSGVEAFLGVAILMDHNPVASMYSLSSTHAGGGLFWAATEVITLGAFVPIYIQWSRSEDRVATRSDAAAVAMSMAPASAAPQGSVPAADRVPSSLGPAARVRVAVPVEQLTAWEYAWMTRTGMVPERFVAPDHAPQPGET